jgi:dinuclear metal center YbgI/SA1388 family protein
MVQRDDLELWLNDFLSARSVQDYAPNGLQIEGRERISRIATAVSVTQEVIDAAVEAGADALVVHHGMFWKNEDPVLRRHRRRRVRSILEAELNLFAYHLPLDLHPRVSHNRLILEGVGAGRVLDPVAYVRELLLGRQPGAGEGESPEQVSRYGLAGLFDPPVPLEELVGRIERFLEGKADSFRYGPDPVSRLFVVSGGGRNELDRVLPLGVDAYLTGEAREATPSVAREAGITYIYAGHYRTERPGIIRLGEEIARAFPVDVRFLDVENPL